MDKFVLSRKTQEDIDRLFKYGIKKFGNNKALEYLHGLNSYFISLKNNPKLGRKRNEIKEGLFSFPYGSHIIFYRIFIKHIRIVRVLHGSKDIPKHFKK